MPPEGWECKAEELGAWERARCFRNNEVLLRTLLIHIALGCSLKETAVRAREADFADVSSVALFKRLRKSGEWLRWMALGAMEKWLVPSRQGLCSMVFLSRSSMVRRCRNREPQELHGAFITR